MLQLRSRGEISGAPDDTLTGTMTARPANTRLENMSSEAPRSARLVRAWRVLSALACMAAFFPFFSIALTQITLSLLLIVWFGIVARGGRRGALPFVTPMLVWLIATVITTLTALDVGLAFGARNDAVWLFALWPLTEAARDPRTRSNMARCLALGGALSSIIALAQGAQEGLGYRIHGTLPHYMTFAGVLLFAISAVSARALFVDARSGVRWVILALMGTALLWSQTRSAWIGVGAALAVLASLRDRRLVLALPLLAGVAYALAPDPVQRRIESFADFTDDTLTERRFMWSAGLDIVRDHPWTGVGPDNLRAVYPEYKLPGDPWPEQRRFTHLHQNAIQIAAERGLIGFAAWAFLVLSVIVTCARRYREMYAASREPRALVAGALAGWVGNQVAGVF